MFVYCVEFVFATTGATVGTGENPGNFEDIKDAYNKMKRLWAQVHHIRAFGTFLLDVFAVTGDVEGDVERVLTVD